PSGEPNRDRYEAEAAVLKNGPYSRSEVSASNGLKVGHIDNSDSSVEFSVQCSKAGWYIVIVRTGNGSSGNALASHKLSVNNGGTSEVFTVYSGWNNWGSLTLRLKLNAGTNTLKVTKGQNFAEIDCLDVFIDQ
ncbi:unnamed protein product, partial [Didymodactylos carnosus]